MAKKIIFTKNAPAPIGPYSQAVAFGNALYVSGQIPLDPNTNKIIEGEITEQSIQVMKNIEAILLEANYSFKEVIKCSIFIKDMNLFGQVNEIYGQYFDSETAPARETVEVARLPKDALVEISCVAMKGE
jgi:2-iminobutanoate/2-iminopropanoate deaminase